MYLNPNRSSPPTTIIEMSNIFYYDPLYLDRLLDGVSSAGLQAGLGIPTNVTAQKGIAVKSLKPT